MPVIVGNGTEAVPEPDTWGMATRSLRHAPSPLTTLVLLEHVAGTHLPPLKTLLPSAQLKQFEFPGPEQLAQELSQLLHCPPPEDVSKNWFLEHVERQRPFERTGLEEGHVEHWLNPPPEQVEQSG